MPCSCTVSHVATEQSPSARAAYTPPCTRPISCLTLSVTGTLPFTQPSPCSRNSMPRVVCSVSGTGGRLPFAPTMATFDQLPADQRAILELVVGRGQSYAELSTMLGMTPARVRELAREALGDLAPATAKRVDPDWRGQVADYLLGQQSGPESTATRGHLKRSEPARAWAFSLLDSLGHLYPNGNMPAIPESDGSEPEPQPEPEPVAPPAAPPPPPPSRSAGLSPAAQSFVRRRRLVIGGIAGAVVIAVVVLLVTGAFSSDNGNKGKSGA